MVTLRVALSDHVYAGDTVTVAIDGGVYTQGITSAAFSGSATNLSTLTHPQVIAHWAWPGYEIVQSNFVLEVVAFHKSGRNGKPLAAVVFEVTDGTTTETVTVTDMTVSTRDGAGSAADNKVLVYAATIPIASFTQSATLTCNFTAYPWVGGGTITSATGITPPSEELCPLMMLCDKDGTYGQAWVVVDDTNGASVTTWDGAGGPYVFSTQAAAEAAYLSSTAKSIKHVGRAVQCVKDFNNDTYGRNEPGGGTALLTGSHDWPGTVPSATQGIQAGWFTVTRHSGVAASAATVQLTGTSQLKAQRLKLSEVSVIGNGSVAVFGAVATDALWIDQCQWNTTAPSRMFGGWKTAYATRNLVTQFSTGSTGNGFVGGAAGSKAPFALVRGNSGPAPEEGRADGLGCLGQFYCVLGNYHIRPQFQATGSTAGAISDGAIAAYNVHFDLPSAWIGTSADTPLTQGNAFVQNLLERTGTEVDWAIQVDQDSVDTDHLLLWHNTIIGARFGCGFSWLTNVYALKSNYNLIGNMIDEFGHKDDTMPTGNAIRSGSMSVGYHVSSYGNVRNRFAGTTEWAGEFSGLYTVDFGTLGYVDNSSVSGGNDGFGDYHLTETSAGWDLMPAGKSPLPYDLNGRARNLSGGGSSGVFEMIGQLVGLGRRVISLGGF